MEHTNEHAIDIHKAAELVVRAPCLPAMTPEAIEKVRRLEEFSLANCEQVEFPTEHLIHGGMYHRTLHMAQGTVLTGALLKVATALVVSGECTVFVGEDIIDLRGYNVLPGSAGRKQVFVAHTDVDMTMSFPTMAKTVADAEREFTDEYELLMTNRQDCVKTLITGE